MENKNKIEEIIIEDNIGELDGLVIDVYADLAFKNYKLDKAIVLPTNFEVNDNLDQANLLVNELNKLINIKQDFLNDLRIAMQDEVKANLKYDHEFNKLLLETDFKAALNESRPTVNMKEAYINEQIKDLYDNKVIIGERVKMLKKMIDLVDERINSENKKINLFLKLSS